MTNGFAAIIGYIALLAYAMDRDGAVSWLFLFLSGAAYGQIIANWYIRPWLIRHKLDRERRFW